MPELEVREQALAAELEALGPVNELAVTERDELEQRHAFLKEQRRDLERSLESLNETVKELDATCAERFLATLSEVNVAFDDVFQRLFGGGEAKAELSDPDAPLESGIEIRVRAAGQSTPSRCCCSPAARRRSRRSRSCSPSSASGPLRSASSTRWTRRSTTQTWNASPRCCGR